MTQCQRTRHRTRVGKLHVILLQTSLFRSRRLRRDPSSIPNILTDSCTCSLFSPTGAICIRAVKHSGKQSLKMFGVRRFLQYTQPFTPWDEISRNHPQHLEVQRFARYRDTERSAAWLSRRSHAQCDIAIPTSWGLDALYLRHEDEWQYYERLHLLRVREITQDRLPELLCMNTPWVPNLWPPPRTNCDVSFANFPPSGDLPDPTGKGVALDSAWRLRERACVGGTGDPGRLIAETRKEYRDARSMAFWFPSSKLNSILKPLRAAHLYTSAVLHGGVKIGHRHRWPCLCNLF
jgi:hypothetical protein